MENKCHIRWKTMLGKKKLLVTSNFSFSHSVSYSYMSLVHQNVVLCGNGLNILGAMQNMDREPLFCTQFAKQKVCPTFNFFMF